MCEARLPRPGRAAHTAGMRTGVRCSIFVLPLVALACGDDSDSRPDGGPPEFDAGPACASREPSAESTSNNSAILTGPGIGTGADPLEALRRPIEAELTAPAALELGDAWASRAFSSNEATWIAIEVSNPTDTLFCRITTESYQWLGEADEPIPTREQIWLTGSIGLDDPLDAMTCLAPGETGYLLDISPQGVAAWDDLRTVELELSYAADLPDPPDLAVVPTAYTADELGRLRVELENVGSEIARFDTETPAFGELVLLDAGGAPLGWTTLGGAIDPADGELLPGARGSIDGAHFYGGCAASLRPFLDFTP